MKKTIKILSDITKKETKRCLVLMWFVLTDHINLIFIKRNN
jgi:hypothetical protein